jgi:hypothetical protein
MLAQINYIFTDNVRILYIYPAISTFAVQIYYAVYCVYPAMSKKSENLSDLNKKDRNKCHSSPFINVVRVTLVPVSYSEYYN